MYISLRIFLKKNRFVYDIESQSFIFAGNCVHDLYV